MRMRLLVLFTGVTALAAATAEYQIAPEMGDEFVLEVAKTGLYSGKKHRFLFQRYHGRIQLDRESPKNASVEMAIESGSAVCTDTWVNAHDVKKIESFALNEMMQVTSYPRLTFVSLRVISRGDKQYDVEGMLTIRGVAKPSLVSITLDQGSEGTIVVTGSGQVRLKDFGLKPPAAALGTIGTRNEMTVRFRLTARPQ